MNNDSFSSHLKGPRSTLLKIKTRKFFPFPDRKTTLDKDRNIVDRMKRSPNRETGIYEAERRGSVEFLA